MFEVGVIGFVDFDPLRGDAFLAGALFPALFDGAAFLAATAFGALFATFFAGTGCLDVAADGAATWVWFEGAASTSGEGAEGPAETVLVAALLTGGPLVVGLPLASLRDPARVARRRVADRGVAVSVAATAGAGGVLLDANAAWTVANASSNES